MTIVRKSINVTYSTFDNAKRIPDILLVFLRNYSLAWPLFFLTPSLFVKITCMTIECHFNFVLSYMFLIFIRQYCNWTLIIVVDLTKSLDKSFQNLSVSQKNACFFCYGIFGELWPSNRGRSREQHILDSRYAFRVLRDTRISLDKSSLLYLFQFRDRQIFLNPVFLEIFSPFFIDYWSWDKEMPKKLQIILPSISSKLILVEQHCWSHPRGK